MVPSYMHVHVLPCGRITMPSSPSRRISRSTKTVRRAPSARVDRVPDPAILARYASQGVDCAFANLRMLGRVVGSIYDDALKPAQVRASQLALMWAILACEPVELARLERVTQTDQTTLSRTVNKLRAAGWVVVAPGDDRRTRVARLTPAGRRRFLDAMPYWEAAQRDIGTWLSIAHLRGLASAARKRANYPQA